MADSELESEPEFTYPSPPHVHLSSKHPFLPHQHSERPCCGGVSEPCPAGDCLPSPRTVGMAGRQPRPLQRQPEPRPRPSCSAETEPALQQLVPAAEPGPAWHRPPPPPLRCCEYSAAAERRPHAGLSPRPGHPSGASPVVSLRPGHPSGASPVVSPRPRSAQPPAPQPAPVSSPRQAASYDSFWRSQRAIEDTRYPLPEEPCNQPQYIPYPPLMKLDHNTAPDERSECHLRDPEPLVEEPPSEHGALSVALTQYTFSQGAARSLTVLDRDPSHLLTLYGRQTQRGLLRGWAELFWLLSVPLLTLTTLLLTLLRWTLRTLVQQLVLAPVQLLGDHLLKPGVVTLHDAVLLPAATLLSNVVASLLLVARPLAQLMAELVAPLATLLGSVRLVQINYHRQSTQSEGSQTA